MSARSSVEESASPTEALVIPASGLSEFWRRCYPEGMTVAQVLKELYDFEICLDNVPKVYDHVTGGQITKVNTDASAVIAIHDDHVNDLVDEAVTEDRLGIEP